MIKKPVTMAPNVVEKKPVDTPSIYELKKPISSNAEKTAFNLGATAAFLNATTENQLKATLKLIEIQQINPETNRPYYADLCPNFETACSLVGLKPTTARSWIRQIEILGREFVLTTINLGFKPNQFAEAAKNGAFTPLGDGKIEIAGSVIDVAAEDKTVVMTVLNTLIEQQKQANQRLEKIETEMKKKEAELEDLRRKAAPIPDDVEKFQEEIVELQKQNQVIFGFHLRRLLNRAKATQNPDIRAKYESALLEIQEEFQSKIGNFLLKEN